MWSGPKSKAARCGRKESFQKALDIDSTFIPFLPLLSYPNSLGSVPRSQFYNAINIKKGQKAN